MANVLYDSYLNPVKFHKLDNVQPANYFSRFMDDWAFRRTIQPWEEKVCFYQPWAISDSIKLQYTSNFAPITLRLYNEAGILQATQAFVTLQQDELQPLFFIREISFDLSTYEPGKYFFTRDAAGVLTYSEPFELMPNEDSGLICLENQDPTLLIEYSHYEPRGGIKFFTGIILRIRVPAILRYKSPGAKDNVYEDQLLNMTMINSVDFRLLEFIAGGNRGIPPYLIDRLARAFGCSDLKIDGRLYTKNEGSNFEPAILDSYPMRGWAIELREKLNRDSVITEDDTIIEGQAAAALLIDAKGFGIDGGATEYQEIISLQ